MKQLADITHPELVAALIKPGEQLAEEFTPTDCKLIHALMGICGEAGELMDAVKKATVYRKPLDRANVIEELGDLEFYMQDLRATLGITREETLAHNIAKLSKRYVGLTYSDKSAQERADKTDEWIESLAAKSREKAGKTPEPQPAHLDPNDTTTIIGGVHHQ